MVTLYQIYFDRKQIKDLDPEMIAYDNSSYNRVVSTRENEREYRVFKDNYEAKTHLDSTYTGFLSWKFFRKTNMRGGSLKQYIINDENKHDVYFVNGASIPKVRNVWQQGNNRHKHLIKITQHVFDNIGYDINLSNFSNSIDQCCFCNFWVGNKNFWDRYMEFTIPVYKYLTVSEGGLDGEMRELFLQRADGGIDANYFSFIMERLFTTLLVVDPSIKFKRT